LILLSQPEFVPSTASGTAKMRVPKASYSWVLDCLVWGFLSGFLPTKYSLLMYSY